MTRLLRLITAASALAFVVAACGSNYSSPSASGGSSSAGPTSSAAASSSSDGGRYGNGGKSGGSGGNTTGAQIKIENFKFGAPLTVTPGAMVEVENEDGASHDVVSDDGLFKTPPLAKGEKSTFKAPDKPGTYEFSCSLHPGSMSGIGTLVVKG